MVKEEYVKIVTEDIVMLKNKKSSKHFCAGYNDFQFPLTVSFYEHGEYMVKIEGKKAVVEKIK